MENPLKEQYMFCMGDEIRIQLELAKKFKFLSKAWEGMPNIVSDRYMVDKVVVTVNPSSMCASCGALKITALRFIR